ncbi:SIMPL domain-containing protein [Gluconacetobacter azotocaptans]|nr:SIMPL domain-containing protein [Gluconacetobacter azotocaptans]
MMRPLPTPPRTIAVPALAILTAASCAVTGPARAQAVPAPASATELTLSATGTVHAPPDRLTATLFAEATAPAVSTAQARVNALIRQATDAAGAAGGLVVVTDSYSVQRDDTPRPPQWTARQSLRLTGGDGAKLLDLVGRLQARGLALSGLDWSLSPDRRTALVQQAEAEALKAVRQRAASAATTLGLTVGTIRSVTLEDRGMPRPMPMMMMAARAALPPTAPPEEQDVTASATATVVLRP